MNTTDLARLPIGTPVRINKHRHAGWTARVAHFDRLTSFYTVRLLLDPDGEELATIHHAGPYVRKELDPLTDPQPGPSGPTFADTDVLHFSLPGGA